MPFKNRGEIKFFPDMQKLKEFVIHRPALKEMLKENFQEGRTEVIDIKGKYGSAQKNEESATNIMRI